MSAWGCQRSGLSAWSSDADTGCPGIRSVAPAGAPALYEVEVVHRRMERLEYAFATRMYLWLVDLDDLPRLPRLLRPLARFRAADHCVGPREDPSDSIRANLEEFLGDQGVDLRGGRVLMLAHARVLGYVFNPISLYWCHDPAGALVCAVAEVHNTYGGRHRYLLEVDPDDPARLARVDKAFYVSPFFTVDGEYRMRVPEPGETLAITVVLRRDDTTAFVATLRGRRRAADTRGVLAAALRHPLVTAKVSALIRRHGLALWARGVPAVPREAATRTHRTVTPTRNRAAHDHRARGDEVDLLGVAGYSLIKDRRDTTGIVTVPLTVRVAEPADADSLLALVHSAYRGPSGREGWTSEADLIDGPRTTRDLLAADLADPAITVLVAGDAAQRCSTSGELLGCAAVAHPPGERAASFGLFAVRPDAQRGGTGSVLLAAAEDHARARGATEMEMCVIDRRAELIAWYERRGYRPSGERRPFPYGAEGVGVPRDADLEFVVLVKNLS